MESPLASFYVKILYNNISKYKEIIMVIIDFEKKGNIVRFYLGEKIPEWGWTKPDYKQKIKGELKSPEWLKPSETFYGDDWDDSPYEHNAGKVYAEFIKGYTDIVFDFDDLVLEPCDGDFYNSSYSKEDMVNRIVPCIIAIPKNLVANNWCTDFGYWVGCDDIKKYYFGDMINDNIIYI